MQVNEILYLTFSGHQSLDPLADICYFRLFKFFKYLIYRLQVNAGYRIQNTEQQVTVDLDSGRSKRLLFEA